MDKYAYNICENINILLSFNEEIGVVYFDYYLLELHNDLKKKNDKLMDYVIEDIGIDNRIIENIVSLFSYLGHEFVIADKNVEFVKLRDTCQEMMTRYEEMLSRLYQRRYYILNWKAYFTTLKSYVSIITYNKLKKTAPYVRRELINGGICSEIITVDNVISDILFLRSHLQNMNK